MTKEELLEYEPGTIRSDPRLYRAFLKIYKEEHGGGCSSCAFNATISRWKEELSVSNINIFDMSNQNNTFKLAQFHSVLWIPGTDRAINANSPDELVIEFLTQDDKKHFQARKKTFFDKLPDGIDEEGNLVVSEEELKKKNDASVKSSITKSKNSLLKQIEKSDAGNIEKTKKKVLKKLEELSAKELHGNEQHLASAQKEVEEAFDKKVKSFDKTED